MVFEFFFFQAEDGIRDRDVTGVQTCALPICRGAGKTRPASSRPVASISRDDYLWPFGCHIAIAAPVGSVMTLIVPCSPTSMTSTTTLAPRSFAFLVDARTSSTPT